MGVEGPQAAGEDRDSVADESAPLEELRPTAREADEEPDMTTEATRDPDTAILESFDYELFANWIGLQLASPTRALETVLRRPDIASLKKAQIAELAEEQTFILVWGILASVWRDQEGFLLYGANDATARTYLGRDCAICFPRNLPGNAVAFGENGSRCGKECSRAKDARRANRSGFHVFERTGLIFGRST